MISGLTPGNLSKISAADKDSRINSAVPEGMALNLVAQQYSQDGSEQQDEPLRKERRTFARGINLSTTDKSQQNVLRNLHAIAPSAHHRFDKDSVHLRSMYRQLHHTEISEKSQSPLRRNMIAGAQSVDATGKKKLGQDTKPEANSALNTRMAGA